MKNNIFYTFFIIFAFLNLNLIAKELEINSIKIKYDNIDKVTIFEGSVDVQDEEGNKIFSEYAKYNKLSELIVTKGETKIITSNGYEILGSDISLDNKKKIIRSSYKTKVTDKEGNKIFVDMFDYSTTTNIFFSKGNIKVLDINNNNYNFSQIYIDENKKKIIGSDVKAFLNQGFAASNKNNEPRIFANTMSISENISTLEKGVVTYCKTRENEKCPPWTLQSKKIKHDLAKKTIYYDNVVLKIYDFPIFFAPKFSHPDPSVKRRSGLLAPVLTNSSTLGTGFGVPYFWNISNDRDLTFTPKIYLDEKPLILAAYRQKFEKSSLIVDAGYTQGYKKKNIKKTSGSRSHFFSNLKMNLFDSENKKSDLEINIEKLSNDTYLKVYDIDTSLVDKNKNILENIIDFSYQNNDFFLGLTPGYYEDTNKNGNLRHEYLLPLTIEKNIMANEKYGFLDLSTNLRVRNYETNKQTNFFVNDLKWKSNQWLNKFGIQNYFEGLLKTVNYESENTDEFKNDDTNTELSTVVGYFAKLGLYKSDPIKKVFNTLTPKVLLRYSPGHMRKVDEGSLKYSNLFNIKKTNEIDVIENGFSTSIGVEYKKNKLDDQNNITDEIFTFSIGQVISGQENKDMPSSTSLEQKFSDVVGEATYKINDTININYNFSIDQNYKETNYNEISSDININSAKFNVAYLQEKKHIGNKEYIQSGVDYKFNNSTELNISTKRNLLTSSAEFYNLSYNYINDCLKAGVAYRREFYADRDIEPTNTLMFRISIIPFAQINTPGFKK